MCLVTDTCLSSSRSTSSARVSESVTRTDAASGSCSAWLTRSAATYAASAVSSARIAISVGPASESIPTMPLSSRFAATRHVERIRTALGGQQSGIVLVDDVAQGIEVINAYAAEHTEIQTAGAAADAARVRNAGAVLIGPWAPVSLGDYCAGSNHVLPTAGCACHSSGLSVRSFLRAVHFVEYSRDALAEVAGHVVTLADAEDLPGHGAAVNVRFDRP